MFGQCTSSPMMLEHTILHPSMVTPGHFVVVLQENLSLFKKEAIQLLVNIFTGMECGSAKGIPFLQFERNINDTVKVFEGQDVMPL